MMGGMLRGRGRPASAGCALLVALGLALAAGQPADATEIYDTTRILEHEGNECAGAPKGQCAPTPPRRYTIPGGQTKGIELACPESRPHVVGWDADHHEHISLELVPPAAEAASAATADHRPGGLTLVVTNHADVPGSASVVLGCSARPVDRAIIVRHTSAVPTKRLLRLRGARP